MKQNYIYLFQSTDDRQQQAVKQPFQSTSLQVCLFLTPLLHLNFHAGNEKMQLQINNMSLMKDHDNKMDDDVSKFSTSNSCRNIRNSENFIQTNSRCFG